MLSAEAVYPASRRLSGDHFFSRCLEKCGDHPEALADVMARLTGEYGLPSYLTELARLEYALFRAGSAADQIPSQVSEITINPTLELLSFQWKNLCRLLTSGKEVHPEAAEERVLVWVDPKTGKPLARPATNNDLLALKIVAERIPVEKAAGEGAILPGEIWFRIRAAARKGLILTPPSAIVRDPAIFPRDAGLSPEIYTSPVFTLQWHITQACDLNCKHCYDRKESEPLPFDRGVAVLDDFTRFCMTRNVSGHISFSGGNPLLYPRFCDLYREASRRGFSLGILGNPTEPGRIEELIRIEKPAFFQVSLEGLAEHNDYIRGPGHFERTLAFLEVLRDLGVFSMVMLTLTRDNMDQVIPLAEMLEGRADLFTFNRLAQVGRGKDLLLPEKTAYLSFVREFIQAADRLSVLARKDNLINAVLYEQDRSVFGGCTGHGCGAAFNFISLLPDGSAHACRKFPSPIGNVFSDTIEAVYDSSTAEQYRAGAAACRGCPVRCVCGGCLAVAYGHGLDVFSEKDPFCPGPPSAKNRLPGPDPAGR
ncbi:thio(seleno)oxazole modification radical SAM maturase SbtM [Desulfosudis oleivorans]|uniref:Radical SAM domain protein n=1 Tax=Desulfosudis oleivorans (strain DSM 6200 / JCM 39069 / Hxd3) TaxID=96561 RepID=A8ZVZ1_DESOH|nr:thio(seleno)oxazole modification radical SAM maturase SbtM [Desulfosudis oleivorans]ABW66700.1 Radical SAM domain protein [Desulfosudis oleivorans Hxd3]